MPLTQQEEVTLCLAEIERGDRTAVQRLLPHVYGDLRRIAGRLFGDQRAEHTLQPTALVHEAYMRLVKPQHQGYQNRQHFLAVAAVAMRQLLQDYARARGTEKRGAQHKRVALESHDLDGELVSDERDAIMLVALDGALTRLRELNSRQADIVEMRFLAGMTAAEVADALGVTERTVFLDWSMAKSWLQIELGEDAS